MKKSKWFIGVLAMIVMVVPFLLSMGGGEVERSSVDQEQSRATEEAMSEMLAEVGMPAITNWQEMRWAKMIFELRDRANLLTYTYLYSEVTGMYTFLGKSIGYGLPYSVQYTNPEKVGTVEGGEYGAVNPYVIPQPDPNGLFMPDGLSATWVMLINEDTGEPQPVYVEPAITVSPFPLPARVCVDGVNQ